MNWRPGNRGGLRRGKAIAIPVILVALTGMLPGGRPTIFLVGDSTMAEKPLIGNPERGWGMAFSLFVDAAAARVENHARGGRSTKSFLREGRWDSVAGKIAPGDFVLIQFGHNDEKIADTNRYAAPETAYRENLTRFVRETRSRGGNPVLLTPVARRKFSGGVPAATHGRYSAVVKEVGEAERVPVLDLDSLTRALIAKEGEEESKGLFLWLRPGVLSRLDTGKTDNTHFSGRGAYAVASLVADEIRRQDLPLARALSASPPPPVASEKTVLLDCYYNNEWRADAAGKPSRFHYVWDDTTNSGFSILGRAIVDAGASIDTLCQRPTRALLSRASVYLIVDPDTPKESPAPNAIDPRDCDAIAAWVRDGGVLAMFGNDSGNAEFTQWNLLAERFGIHFTEESVNRVAGREYSTGTFDQLPGHPLFCGVGPIFLKEISTLVLTHPAEPLLTANGKAIMAVARYGKGVVFAVGDPWLYNEYMDARRLPERYGNAKAGANLFRWLCTEARPVVWR